MLLAHLAGNLAPYYSRGVTSMVAEQAILTAISAQLSAQYEGQLLMAQAAFASCLTPQGVQDFFASLTGGFESVRDRAMLDFSRTPEKVREKSRGLRAVYEELQRTGFFDKLNEETEKTLRKAGFHRT